MSRATPAIRAFAARLVEYEAKHGKKSAAKAPAAFTVCEKMAPHLAPLMGKAGFRALLSRAVAMAGEEVSWFRALKVGPDGRLTGFEKLKPAADTATLERESEVLPALLIGLLVAFVGERLTLGLVRDVWPTLPGTALNFGKGKTK